VKTRDLLRRLNEAQQRIPSHLLDVDAVIRRAHRLFTVSLAGVIVGVAAISATAAVGVNEIVRPDPIVITGSWRVIEFEETQNVKVVSSDFTGAVLQILPVACDDEPCPVVISSVRSNENAEILEGMRLSPEEGGSIYTGRKGTISDCVNIESPNLVVAEAVYDTTHTVRWQRAVDGSEEDLSFSYRQASKLNTAEARCPDETALEAAFIASRMP
jgi:hypothetical protein